MSRRTWKIGTQTYRFDEQPLPWLMGIVNVTPDSFSDGGEYIEATAAIDHGLQLAEEGADILDIGGESTRPGSESVSLEDELKRVIPVVESLASRTDRLISIDTTKAEVARQAIAAGASIVNDISGLTFDPQMPGVCAVADVGIIAMHIQGTPQTMQDNPHYENVVEDICTHFTARLHMLAEQGIDAERICLDPGIGFGKTAEHNLQILASIDRFHELDRPVLIGHSRKRFLKKVLGRELDERTQGTVGVSIACAAQHVDLLRIHDVAATRDALLAWHAVMSR